MKTLKKWNKFVNERFATESGIKIDRICQLIGYGNFHEFIEDNPGCADEIIKWIEQYFSDKLVEDMIDIEELEELGLYDTADKIRDIIDEDDEDNNK